MAETHAATVIRQRIEPKSGKQFVVIAVTGQGQTESALLAFALP
jgi:Lhr-like helicase